MGNCFACNSGPALITSQTQTQLANVVSLAGELRRYSVGVTVSQVLRDETPSPSSFFLCNSDHLSFNDYVPSLSPHEELEPEQIYFIMPISKLRDRLAASEMAAMAVVASAAFTECNRRRGRKPRISPILANAGGEEGSRSKLQFQINETKSKRRKSGFRRAKMSFRLRTVGLLTINEDSVLLA